MIVSVDRDGAGLLTRDKDYYRKLYGRDGDGTGLIDDAAGLGAIAYQLQTRDLGDYSGEDRAPDTSAKKLMQRRTASPLAKWMVEHAADKLRFRLVTIDDVIETLPQDLRTNYRGADSKPGDIRQDVGDILKLAPFYAENLGRMRAGADFAPVVHAPRTRGEPDQGQVCRQGYRAAV